MKMIVSILVESPFYFTISLRDRFGLVRRLKKTRRIFLSATTRRISSGPNGSPGSWRKQVIAPSFKPGISVPAAILSMKCIRQPKKANATSRYYPLIT